VAEQFESCAASVAKDEEGTGEGILLQFPLADGRQSIDAVTKVDGLAGH